MEAGIFFVTNEKARELEKKTCNNVMFLWR